MEKELNIAAILRDKPNVKLWSPIVGECKLEEIDPNGTITIEDLRTARYYFDYLGRLDGTMGETTLFPSKSMQDWNKLTWKKGEVLTDEESFVIFKCFKDDDYTEFSASFAYEDNAFRRNLGLIVDDFRKVSDIVAQEVIKRIEEHYGGKLNLSTLEIEKPKQEFKNGDILFIKGETKNSNSIGIFKDDGNYLNSHLWANYFYKRDELRVAVSSDDYVMGPAFDDKVRFATIEEILKVFAALEKEGKAWDADKKKIVDLPKKCEFKPFDKVLVRNGSYGTWRADIYSDYKNYIYPHNCIGGMWKQCIPYNDQTAHLLGTTDDWKGGEE